MSTCSVSKVRGEGALSNRRSGRDGTGRIGWAAGFPSRLAEAAGVARGLVPWPACPKRWLLPLQASAGRGRGLRTERSLPGPPLRRTARLLKELSRRTAPPPCRVPPLLLFLASSAAVSLMPCAQVPSRPILPSRPSLPASSLGGSSSLPRRPLRPALPKGLFSTVSPPVLLPCPVSTQKALVLDVNLA